MYVNFIHIGILLIYQNQIIPICFFSLRGLIFMDKIIFCIFSEQRWLALVCTLKKVVAAYYKIILIYLLQHYNL